MSTPPLLDKLTICQYKRGKLSWKDAQNPNAPYDKTDIIHRTHIDDEHFDYQVLSNGWMGFLHHGGGQFTIGTHHIATVKNDCFQLHNGSYHCDYQIARHDAAFTYSDENHSDICQFFAKNLDWSNADVFDGLYIGEGEYFSRHQNRNAFIASEVCQYKNITLWPNGVKLDSDSNLPHLLHMSNGTNVTVGSASHPIDPKQISNKTIRIGTRKRNNPDSENIIIHAYPGLKVQIDKQAKEAVTIRRYKRSWKPQERQQNWELYQLGKALGEQQ